MAVTFNVEEIFQIGIQIEKNGNAFYKEAADKCNTPEVKKLLLDLAEWEKSHIEIFEKLKETIPQKNKNKDVFDSDNMIHLYLKSIADSKVFVKGLKLSTEDLEAASPVKVLETALEFEKDSVVLFSSMKEIITDSSSAKQVEKLIKEELKHIGYITAQITKLNG
ncbi:MAG: ferritin family protein [Chitinispirillaceae bacterium]|nr:ferritin family protein [Chitinispirillaceae bacterium]